MDSWCVVLFAWMTSRWQILQSHKRYYPLSAAWWTQTQKMVPHRVGVFLMILRQVPASRLLLTKPRTVRFMSCLERAAPMATGWVVWIRWMAGTTRHSSILAGSMKMELLFQTQHSDSVQQWKVLARWLPSVHPIRLQTRIIPLELSLPTTERQQRSSAVDTRLVCVP